MNDAYFYLHQDYEQFVQLNDKVYKLLIPQSLNSFSPHYLIRFFELKRNAILFHYSKGYIKGISSVQEKVKVQESNSFSIIIEYRELKKPIRIRQYINEFVSFLPKRYVAFQSDGTPNSGSLYPCTLELANYFIEKIELNEEINFVETEVIQQIRARVGHLLYKQKLINIWSHKCALCSIDLFDLLRASHAKPWKISNSFEKINPYNGLLLCVLHDALFDQGFIGFTDNGKIIISNRIPVDDYLKYNIDRGTGIPITDDHKRFIKYHRDNVFK
jgi:hypothetical protein